MKRLSTRLIFIALFPSTLVIACVYLFPESFAGEHLVRRIALVALAGCALTALLSLRLWRTLNEFFRGISRDIKLFPSRIALGPEPAPMPEVYRLHRQMEEFLNHASRETLTLRLEKGLLQSLLNAFREGVFCLDSEGLILYQNPALDADLVLPESQGRPYFKAIRNSEILEYAHQIVRLDAAGDVGDVSPLEEAERRTGLFETREVRDANRFYKLNCYPVRPTDEAGMYLFIVRDETEQQNVRRMRQEFLQNASHELKTPITSIRGYAETLLPRAKEEPLKSFMDAILRNVHRMESIIEDMVAISYVESREYPFHPEWIDIRHYMGNITAMVTGALQARDQELHLDIPDEFRAYADPLLLEHLLLNLIANASRYSPEKSVVKVRFSAGAGNRTLVEVSDQGPGVPAELRNKIFERFFRVDRMRSRDEGGTGSENSATVVVECPRRWSRRSVDRQAHRAFR